MPFSFWDQQSFLSNYDVAIIGSGIVGLNAAWSIKKKSPSLRIVVLERGSIPRGASTRNAGVACFGTSTEILNDLKTQSEEEVFKLVQRRWEGLRKLRENLGDKNIGFESESGYELFFNSDENKFEECMEKLGYLNQRLSPIIGSFTTYKPADKKINKFGFAGVNHLIENVAEAQIDSGKMMNVLIQKTIQSGVTILNGMEVESYREENNNVHIQCKNNLVIKTKKMVLATNGFSKTLESSLDIRPARAQVIITSEIQDLKVKGSFHFDEGFYFFRNVGKRLLFGGGRNLDFATEETTAFGLTEKVQSQLEKTLSKKILPGTNYTIENRWSGIMGMGNEKSPIVKALSPSVFCAIRLSGMGVAIGSLVGEEAADLVLSQI